MVQKNIILFLLLVPLGIWSVTYQDFNFLLIFASLTVLSLICYIMLFFIRRRVVINVEIRKDRAYAGDDQEILFDIENKSLCPLLFIDADILLKNELYETEATQKVKLCAAGRGFIRKSVTFELACAGNIRVSIKKARLCSFLRLSAVSLKSGGERVFPVIPKLIVPQDTEPPKNMYAAIDSDIFSKTQKGEDPSEVFDHRTYEPGDRLNTVNWKLSARKGEMMVKELSLPVGEGMVILLELNSKGAGFETERVTDTLLMAAFSLSSALILSGNAHILAWYNSKDSKLEHIRVTEETDLAQIAALVMTCPIYSQERVVFDYYEEFSGKVNSHVYYITAGCSEAVEEELCTKQPVAIKKEIYVTGKAEHPWEHPAIITALLDPNEPQTFEYFKI